MAVPTASGGLYIFETLFSVGDIWRASVSSLHYIASDSFSKQLSSGILVPFQPPLFQRLFLPPHPDDSDTSSFVQHECRSVILARLW